MGHATTAAHRPSSGRRIAHLNDIAFVASTLATAQAARGDRAIVVDPAKPGGEWPYPRKALTVPLRAAAVISAIARIVAYRPDVVHVHYATHAPVGAVIGRPFVVHCHGSDVRSLAIDGPLWQVLRWTTRRAGAVIAATPDLLPRVRILRSDAEFIPNPIDVGRFAPGGEPSRDVLLGVRLHPVKGAATAIDAVAELVRRRPQTTVTIVDDGPLAGYAARRLGPTGLLVPRIRHARMVDILRAHRVTLGQFRLGILSQFELEAMACGVPLVADLHAVGPYAEAPPVPSSEDVASIAAQLSSWLEDDAERRAAGLAMRGWVERVHAAGVVAGRLDELYERARKVRA